MKGAKPKISSKSLKVGGTGSPIVPRGLPKDVQAIWKQLASDMVGAGIADRADWPLVEVAATRIARMRQARRIVDREGMTTMSTKGTMMVHPCVRVEREAAGEVRMLLEQLGIGPLGRARLGKHGGRGLSVDADLDLQVGPRGLRVIDGGASS